MNKIIKIFSFVFVSAVFFALGDAPVSAYYYTNSMYGYGYDPSYYPQRGFTPAYSNGGNYGYAPTTSYSPYFNYNYLNSYSNSSYGYQSQNTYNAYNPYQSSNYTYQNYHNSYYPQNNYGYSNYGNQSYNSSNNNWSASGNLPWSIAPGQYQNAVYNYACTANGTRGTYCYY